MRKTALQNYSNIIFGNNYKILRTGRDYYQIKVKGKIVHCPFWVFERDEA
jgi:hypothetical protein